MSRFGNDAEKRTARRLKLKRQPASGRFAGAKADLRTTESYLGDGWLLEQKATERASYGLKLETLRQLSQQAGMQRLRPAFLLVFAQGDGNPKPGGAWVAIPERLFEELVLRAG